MEVQQIPVQPISGAAPLMCWHNVQRRIRACGGSAVFGWEIRDDNFNYIKLSHVVWCDPDGKLVCVTPKFGRVIGENVLVEWPGTIQFERDDNAVFEGKSLGNIYVPKIDNRHLATACEYMTRADRFLHNLDLGRCRWWTQRANIELQRAQIGFAGWDVPSSLELGDILATMGVTNAA